MVCQNPFMYAVDLVEHGPTDEARPNPVHPYARLFLSDVPDARAEMSTKSAHVGEPPRVIDPGAGCRFRWRCPLATDSYTEVTPRLRLASPEHEAAAHANTPEKAAPTGGPPHRRRPERSRHEYCRRHQWGRGAGLARAAVASRDEGSVAWT